MIPFMMGTATGTAVRIGRDVSDGFRDTFEKASSNIAKTFGVARDFVSDRASDFVHGVGKFAGQVKSSYDAAVEGGQEVAEGVRSFPGRVLDGARDLGHRAISGLKGWWVETKREFDSGYDDGYQRTSAVREAGVSDAAKEVVESAGEAVRDAAERVKDDAVAEDAHSDAASDSPEAEGNVATVKIDGEEVARVTFSEKSAETASLAPTSVDSVSGSSLEDGFGDLSEEASAKSVSAGDEPTLEGESPSRVMDGESMEA